MLEKLEFPMELVGHCQLEPSNPSEVHPNYPPDDGLVHEVREGESFITIANSPKYAPLLVKYREKVPAGLLDDLSEELANARALIYFNYRTTVPEYVNWYLLNVNCCYHATEDRCNRRFSNFDKEVKSPRYGKVKRAGKIYIPTEKVKPSPKKLPDIRKIHMWARLHYQDGLFQWLDDFAGGAKGAGAAGTLLDTLEDVLRRRGIDWSPQELRKIAKLRKFARPLRRALKAFKYAGWAATVADILIGRVVTGYLVMTYEEPFDRHFAWEVDIVLKGTGVFGSDGGSFTTRKDSYSIRTSVFDPEHQWQEKKLSATMTGSSFAMSVLDAFKRLPYAKDPSQRAFAGSRFVMGRPGPFDWPLSMPSMHSLGGGVAFYHTVKGWWSRISNGRQLSFAKIMDV